MRETEMYSMGSMATMPQPMSRKAPKDSRWVTTAATTDPGHRCSRKKSMARSWTARRERIARGAPFSSACRADT